MSTPKILIKYGFILKILDKAGRDMSLSDLRKGCVEPLRYQRKRPNKLNEKYGITFEEFGPKITHVTQFDRAIKSLIKMEAIEKYFKPENKKIKYIRDGRLFDFCLNEFKVNVHIFKDIQALKEMAMEGVFIFAPMGYGNVSIYANNKDFVNWDEIEKYIKNEWDEYHKHDSPGSFSVVPPKFPKSVKKFLENASPPELYRLLFFVNHRIYRMKSFYYPGTLGTRMIISFRMGIGEMDPLYMTEDETFL